MQRGNVTIAATATVAAARETSRLRSVTQLATPNSRSIAGFQRTSGAKLRAIPASQDSAISSVRG